MGRDNQAKARQASKLVRRKAQRASYDRILIVSEGSCTEPNYFREIRAAHRLHSANVQVRHSELGTQPLQVVDFALELFLKGDPAKGIRPRAFEQVYALFDRDDHQTYHAALTKAQVQDRRLKNDLNQPVRFEAIASVPCFELWLLLHFEDVLAPLHRDEVHARLKHHLPRYEKGGGGHYTALIDRLPVAAERALQLATHANAFDGHAPYTQVGQLVAFLTAIKGASEA